MKTEERALDDLQFIRDTMERSTQVTSVSGIGLIAMGLTATAGAYVAGLRDGSEWWIGVWFFIAIVGCTIGFTSMWYKADRTNGSIFTETGKRFALSLAPPIVAGCLLTQLLYMNQRFDLMPVTWLLLYGAGVTTGGAFSIRLIPMMGVLFMALGAFAIFLPNLTFAPVLGSVRGYDLLLAAGFGGLHIAFGAVIAKRHGG